MAVNNEYLTYDDIYKDIHDDENDGLPSFRHFCHLSCVAVRDVSDCHSPFSVICIAFCSDACWVKASQSVCTHEMSFVYSVTEKGFHRDDPCNHHLLDFLVRDDPREEKESLQFCGFLSCVCCIPSRTVYTERTYQHPQGETRQYLENCMERMLRSRQEISEMKERLEIIPYMDKILASNRRRYLQLVRTLLKRYLVTLIEDDEVREHASVFLVENRRKVHSD